MGAVKERSREGLSAYEIKRLEQIAKNEARLTALGIKGAVGRLVEDCDARKREQAQKRSEASRRAAESRRQRLIAGPTRGSERNKGKPKPTYRDDSYYSDFFTASRRAGGGGKRRSAPRDPLAARGGCPDQWPPDQVVLAAVKEAEDIVKSAKAKGGPAWLKVMSPSQVSGGFWMNMPSESRAAFSHLPEKCSIELECEGKRWPTVFLPRGKSGAGLSGGWRGFAIDLEIGTGDVCVFHLTSKRVLTTHIIRHKGERTYGSSGKQKQCDSKASTDTECAEGESHDEHVPEEDTRDGEPVRSWRNWLVSAISGKNTGKGTGEEKPAAAKARSKRPPPAVVAPKAKRAKGKKGKSSPRKFDESILGSKVSCWWEAEGAWFEGELTSFTKGAFTVTYFDGDTEVLTLPDDTVVFI